MASDNRSDEAPLTYEGTSILLDTTHMKVDHPYPVVWRGEPAVAIRNADGSVDFSRIAGLGQLMLVVFVVLVAVGALVVRARVQGKGKAVTDSIEDAKGIYAALMARWREVSKLRAPMSSPSAIMTVVKLTEERDAARAEVERLRAGLRHIGEVAESAVLGREALSFWWFGEQARVLLDSAKPD